jgi:2-polyprenyl-3-methyl-5-hydroxy-6-metoxy-1,4-benzoquinol methylase
MSANAAAAADERITALRYPLKRDPYSSHSVIAREVRRLIRSRDACPPLVLDAGCGAGPLGALLAGERLSLVGVDWDPVALEHARALGYTGLVEADLEADDLPDELGPADIVVCADVLEHCRRPEAVLRRLVERCLRPGGTVLVSLPNVAHWYIRAQLLAGRWTYADRGILDRTHLRFFTGATAAALLAAAGLLIVQQWATPLPLPEVYPVCGPGRPLFGLHQFSAHLTNCWPSLLAYQFVYAATHARPPASTSPAIERASDAVALPRPG